jgi:hypothetical protein
MEREGGAERIVARVGGVVETTKDFFFGVEEGEGGRRGHGEKCGHTRVRVVEELSSN